MIYVMKLQCWWKKPVNAPNQERYQTDELEARELIAVDETNLQMDLAVKKGKETVQTLEHDIRFGSLRFLRRDLKLT